MITTQQQPTKDSCVSTCLAMVLSVPCQIMIDKFHERYRYKGENIKSIMEEAGIGYEAFGGLDHVGIADLSDGVYWVTVPSLNIPGGYHQVLIEITDGGDMWCLHDPQRGKEGILYYSANPDLSAESWPGARPLLGYCIEARVWAK